MALVNFNFHFGGTKEKVEELDSEAFENLKYKARIAIIDDEEVPHMENLTADGYNVHHLIDVPNIDGLIKNGYNVIILDIQGIGANLAGEREGWGILEYLKKEYPNIVVLVFTGADWSITRYKETADMADYILGKDIEYLNFKMKLDAAIRKAFSIDYHIEILKDSFRRAGMEGADIEKIIRNHGRNKKKALKKISSKTQNEQVLRLSETILSIISSIYSLIPA